MQEEIGKADTSLIDELMDKAGEKVLEDELGNITARKSPIQPEDETIEVVLARDLSTEELWIVGRISRDNPLGNDVELCDLAL